MIQILSSPSSNNYYIFFNFKETRLNKQAKEFNMECNGEGPTLTLASVPGHKLLDDEYDFPNESSPRTSKENENPIDNMSDDSIQLIPDTPSPLCISKFKEKGKGSSLPRKLQLLVGNENSIDDLRDPFPRNGCKLTSAKCENQDHEKVHGINTESASTSTMKNFLMTNSTKDASGDEGDLSSDTDISGAGKQRNKKSPSKTKKEVIDLGFSDDSDLDVYLIPSKSNRKKAQRKSIEKKGKRRSLLPPIPGILSPDSNSAEEMDDDYPNSVIKNLKREGRFFPSVTSNPSISGVNEIEAPVFVSNPDCDIVFNDTPTNSERTASTATNSSPVEPMDTDNSYGGAKPKYEKQNKSLKKTNHRSTESDSDSLLSPPKRSKAAFIADDLSLAKKNKSRMMSRTPMFKFDMETHSTSSDRPHSPPIIGALQSKSKEGKHNNSGSSDESSDLDENEWTKFIENLSRPYVDLEKKSPARQKRKARRRSVAGPSASRDSFLNIPDIVISPPKDMGGSPKMCFSLSPSISFSNSNDNFEFTGRKSNSESSKAKINDKTYTLNNDTKSCDSSDLANVSSKTLESPLTNMITEMAIQDIDFESDLTPARSSDVNGFQPASSLMFPSSSNPNSFSLRPQERYSTNTVVFPPTGQATPDVIELDNDESEDVSPLTSTRQRVISRPRREKRRSRSLIQNSKEDVVVLGSTPATRQKQIDDDELLARRLQEEIDKEYEARNAPEPQPMAQPSFPGQATSSSARPPLQRIINLSQYEFDVLCALVEGHDLPDAPDGQHRGLEEIVDPDLLAYIERMGVEFVRSERALGNSYGSSNQDLHQFNFGGAFDPHSLEGAIGQSYGGFTFGQDVVEGTSRRRGGSRRRGPSTRRNSQRQASATHMMELHEALEAGNLEEMMYLPGTSYTPPHARRSNSSGSYPSGINEFVRIRGGGGLMPPLNVSFGNDYEALLALGEQIGDVKSKGLSKDKIDMLPLRTFKKNPNVTLGSKAECNVCCCEYEEGDELRILPCFHEYHSHCVDTWIKKNATCPVCRANIWQLYTEGSSTLPKATS